MELAYSYRRARVRLRARYGEKKNMQLARGIPEQKKVSQEQFPSWSHGKAEIWRKREKCDKDTLFYCTRFTSILCPVSRQLSVIAHGETERQYSRVG